MKLEPMLYVADLSRSIDFYRRVLGFKLGKLYPNEERPTYAPLYVGNDKLMLVQGGPRMPAFHRHEICGSGVQLLVQVDRVDQVYEQVREQAQVVDCLEDKTWGDREFTISDPDGYLVTFYTSS